MRRFRLVREERGVALVFAIVFMAALAAGLTTVIVASSSSDRTANRATAAQDAYHLAEAGISSAMSVLHGMQADGVTPVDSLDSTALPPPPPDPGAHTDTYENGTVTWGGTLDTSTQQWTIISKGVVTNPTGPNTAAVERTLTGISQVEPSLTQPVNNAVWNFIYAWNAGGSTNCDVLVKENVSVSAPIYVEGNLCLNNNAVITEQNNNPPTPVNMVVKGKVKISNGASIGLSTAPISEAHLLGGCGSSLTSVHTCTSADRVYADVLDTSPTAIGPPAPSWDTYYTSANPGPAHACKASSALNPPLFDNDGTLNLSTNGSAGTLDLTPTSSFTCEGYNASGIKVGELSWNASSKVLTVNGVIYFDGNIQVSNGAVNDYNGQGTIYATGTFWLNGKMCGVRLSDGTDCDFDSWDPNQTMLIVVAHGDDGSGNSVTFQNNARWQGGIYCQNTLDFSNNAVVEGPVLAGYVAFSNNVEAKPFPVITEVPLGAPGNPNVYADAQPPVITG